MDTQPDLRSLYDADEYAWLLHQAAALIDGRLDEIDRDTLAEYLTDMAKRDVREVVSRLTILLMHLLKYQFQPSRASRSWMKTIQIQQEEITDIFDDSPTLRRKASDKFSQAYDRAKKLASVETGSDVKTFPETCPWALADALDPNAPTRIDEARTHPMKTDVNQ